LLHKSVGGGMTTVTVRVQVLALPQQCSTASQVWVITPVQPLPDMVLVSSVTVTLLQHRSTYGGGLV